MKKLKFTPSFVKKPGPEPKAIVALPENFRKNREGPPTYPARDFEVGGVGLHPIPDQVLISSHDGHVPTGQNPQH